MNLRPFGKTGLEVSPLTFGAWSIGGPARLGEVPIGWTGVNDTDSVRALQTAREKGITVFDTSDKYAEGHSEKLIGNAFSSCRDDIVLVTKTGIVGIDAEGIVLDLSPDRIREACHASLKRLQTDRVEIYLLHLVNDRTFPGDDTRAALERLKQEGKIRHFGISIQYAHQGMRQLEEEFGDAMMLEYNPFKQKDETLVLDKARERGVGVITRGALEKGLLTGKYAPGHIFDPDDVRSRIPAEYRDRVLGTVAKLQKDHGLNRSDLLGLALAFPLRHAGCSTVAVGMKTSEQVRELAEALREAPRNPEYETVLQA